MKNILHYFEERRLVAHFQQGDRAAFDTLYETYAKRVFAFVLPLVGGCHADAEDLVQETFIAAFQATESFRGNSRVLTWLLGVALRRFRDGKRRQYPITLSLREELDSQTTILKTGSFEHTLIESICYQQALIQLEESQRIAFLLVASQNLTHKEAGTLLNTPVPTIKWRVAQATKHLRTLLSDQDDKVKKRGYLMCPIKIEEDLILLASGELNVFRSWTLRRHLTQCSDCQKVWHETQLVWHNAASHSASELPAHLHSDISREFPIFKKKTARSSPQRFVLGALVATGLMGTLLLVNQPKARHTTEGIAFAQVEEAMGNIRTVKWRETFMNTPSLFRDGHVEVRKLSRPSLRWARMNQPAISRIREGISKTVSFSTQSFLISKGKTGRFYCASYSEGIIPSSIWEPKASSTPEERIRQAVLFSKDFGEEPTQWTQKSQNQQYPVKRNAWKRSEDILGQKKTLLFESSLSYDTLFTSPDKSGNAWHEIGETWRFWVDPQTYRIVRREVQTHYSGYGKTIHSTLVSDQFRYNETPPPDTFEFQPPVGSKYTYVPLPQRPATEQEQKQINATIQSALNAWNKQDMKAFGDTWDFDYQAITKEQQVHQKRSILSYAAKNLRGKVTVRQIGKASSRISGVYCRRTATDPFPPKQPVEFGLGLQTYLTDSAGKTTGCFINLNLSRQADGNFKIVRWMVVRIPSHHQ